MTDWRNTGLSWGASFALLRDLLAQTRYKPISFASLWAATNVGSGSVVTNNFSTAVLRTGATGNSSTLYRMGPIPGFNSGAGSHTLFDWSKRASFFFSLQRDTTDAQAVSRVQFKETNSTTIAQLAERGVGLQLDNLTLTGEAYGTERGTVDLSTTLAAGRTYTIEIRLDSTGCEFFVNNVTKGKISTAGQFPTVIATAECNGFLTHANGAAGTNSDLICNQMSILQQL